MKRVKNVDEYIANAPETVRGRLIKLRGIIRKVVPEAEEKISYRMPYYGYFGRLVYFAHAKKHIGLYVPPPVIEEHKDELRKYKTAKAAVRFPLDKSLPLNLIKKLVKDRASKNEANKGKGPSEQR